MLIECIKNLPVLNGRRQQLINPFRGKVRTIELLYGPPQALKTVTRLNQRMFKLLLNRLVNNYELYTQEGISVEQKLMIFIARCGGRLTGKFVA
jgi:hypothetical protein